MRLDQESIKRWRFPGYRSTLECQIHSPAASRKLRLQAANNIETEQPSGAWLDRLDYKAAH